MLPIIEQYEYVSDLPDYILSKIKTIVMNSNYDNKEDVYANIINSKIKIIIMIIFCTIITPIFLKNAFKGQEDTAGNAIFEEAFMLTAQADEITEDLFHRRQMARR